MPYTACVVGCEGTSSLILFKGVTVPQQDTYALLVEGANIAEYAVTPIPGERAIGNRIRVRVQGKRCVARTATNVIKPEGNAFGYVRFGARGAESESDSDITAIILIVAPPGENAVYYIVPSRDWKMLLREQGQNTRSGTGSAPALNVPHPPQQKSRLEPYRNNWPVLA